MHLQFHTIFFRLKPALSCTNNLAFILCDVNVRSSRNFDPTSTHVSRLSQCDGWSLRLDQGSRVPFASPSISDLLRSHCSEGCLCHHTWKERGESRHSPQLQPSQITLCCPNPLDSTRQFLTKNPPTVRGPSCAALCEHFISPQWSHSSQQRQKC